MPANEIDHVPGKAIFPNKLRPKGFEFPSCSRCNRLTSGDEAVVAFVSRVLGGWRIFPDLDPQFFNAISTIEKSYPGIHNEIRKGYKLVNVNGLIQRVGLLSFDSWFLNRSLCRYSAKLSMAGYYNQFGRSFTAGTIETFWAHAQKAGDFQKVLGSMPRSISLRQGKWDSESAFFFKSALSDGGTYICASVFFRTLALFAIIPAENFKIKDRWQFSWDTNPDVGLHCTATDFGDFPPLRLGCQSD